MATLRASDCRRIPGRVGAEEIGLFSLKQKAHRLIRSGMVILGGVRSCGRACAAMWVEAICQSLGRSINLHLEQTMGGQLAGETPHDAHDRG
jgi:hypothetical protein